MCDGTKGEGTTGETTTTTPAKRTGKGIKRRKAADCPLVCHGNNHSVKCRPGRPLCRVRRAEKGLCGCAAYHYPHAHGRGLCIERDGGRLFEASQRVSRDERARMGGTDTLVSRAAAIVAAEDAHQAALDAMGEDGADLEIDFSDRPAEILGFEDLLAG